MADMDWGWKRKRSSPVVGYNDDESDPEIEALDRLINEALAADEDNVAVDVDKKNVASIARNSEKRPDDATVDEGKIY